MVSTAHPDCHSRCPHLISLDDKGRVRKEMDRLSPRLNRRRCDVRGDNLRDGVGQCGGFTAYNFGSTSAVLPSIEVTNNTARLQVPFARASHHVIEGMCHSFVCFCGLVVELVEKDRSSLVAVKPSSGYPRRNRKRKDQ